MIGFPNTIKISYQTNVEMFPSVNCCSSIGGPTALADSTCMAYGAERYDMTCSQWRCSVVGQYGGCVAIGFMDECINFVIAKLQRELLSPGKVLRIGYVPAENCHPRHSFPTHACHQHNFFDSYAGRAQFIATPTLMAIGEVYRGETGCELFKSKGVPCTEPGRQWLMCFFHAICSIP